MQPKITMQQFEDMLFDPAVPDKELRQYLNQNDLASRSFDPALEIDDDKVSASDAEAAMALGGFNAISRFRRQEQYRHRIDGGWTGPRLVSEGDSWFQFPILLDDVIDALEPDFAIWSMGAAGDMLIAMTLPEIVRAIRTHNPHALLISGGGNDILNGSNLIAYLDDFDPARDAEGHINGHFAAFHQKVLDLYRQMFIRLTAEFPNLPVLCHGYDYAIPAGGKWLGRPMESKGIVDQHLQRTIIRVIIDRHNAAMTALTAQFPQVHFIDIRGQVTGWHDELHPDEGGYARVAGLFRGKLRSLFAGS